MNVLWDWRLFSLGYRDRGVGRYCRAVATAILGLGPDLRIFAWADPAAVPGSLRSERIAFLPYRGGGWKSAIAELPLLALRHRIELVHYWIALGPLSPAGIAPCTFAPAVATVYDLGVELWDVPHCRAVRSGKYWKAQRLFFHAVDGLSAISRATLSDVTGLYPGLGKRSATIYMPLDGMDPVSSCEEQREPYFITLGGSVHKNCSRVVTAFARVRRLHPEWKLLVLGHIDPAEERLSVLPEGVVHEPSMERYEEHLRRCSGLLFCSLYEGLGIPPLEAMRRSCPLLLSSIPSLLETCGNAGRFVNPFSVESIEEGIADLVFDAAVWSHRSRDGWDRYQMSSSDAGLRQLDLYRRVTGTRIACSGNGQGKEAE